MTQLLFESDATDEDIRHWARENLHITPVVFVELNTLLPDGNDTARIDWWLPGKPVTRFKRNAHLSSPGEQK